MVTAVKRQTNSSATTPLKSGTALLSAALFMNEVSAIGQDGIVLREQASEGESERHPTVKEIKATGEEMKISKMAFFTFGAN